MSASDPTPAPATPAATTHALVSAALASAQSVHQLSQALKPVAPIVIKHIGHTSSGDRLSVIEQPGMPPKLKTGKANRGGKAVRARQEDHLHTSV